MCLQLVPLKTIMTKVKTQDVILLFWGEGLPGTVALISIVEEWQGRKAINKSSIAIAAHVPAL